MENKIAESKYRLAEPRSNNQTELFAFSSTYMSRNGWKTMKTC